MLWNFISVVLIKVCKTPDWDSSCSHHSWRESTLMSFISPLFQSGGAQDWSPTHRAVPPTFRSGPTHPPPPPPPSGTCHSTMYSLPRSLLDKQIVIFTQWMSCTHSLVYFFITFMLIKWTLVICCFQFVQSYCVLEQSAILLIHGDRLVQNIFITNSHKKDRILITQI